MICFGLQPCQPVEQAVCEAQNVNQRLKPAPPHKGHPRSYDRSHTQRSTTAATVDPSRQHLQSNSLLPGMPVTVDRGAGVPALRGEVLGYDHRDYAVISSAGRRLHVPWNQVTAEPISETHLAALGAGMDRLGLLLHGIPFEQMRPLTGAEELLLNAELRRPVLGSVSSLPVIGGIQDQGDPVLVAGGLPANLVWSLSSPERQGRLLGDVDLATTARSPAVAALIKKLHPEEGGGIWTKDETLREQGFVNAGSRKEGLDVVTLRDGTTTGSAATFTPSLHRDAAARPFYSHSMYILLNPIGKDGEIVPGSLMIDPSGRGFEDAFDGRLTVNPAATSPTLLFLYLKQRLKGWSLSRESVLDIEESAEKQLAHIAVDNPDWVAWEAYRTMPSSLTDKAAIQSRLEQYQHVLKEDGLNHLWDLVFTPEAERAIVDTTLRRNKR